MPFPDDYRQAGKYIGSMIKKDFCECNAFTNYTHLCHRPYINGMFRRRNSSNIEDENFFNEKAVT